MVWRRGEEEQKDVYEGECLMIDTPKEINGDW
jgi:hypothetical protein